MKVGDKVKLKSGGPVMVIAKIENNTAECVWFAEDGDIESCTLPLETLEEVG